MKKNDLLFIRNAKSHNRPGSNITFSSLNFETDIDFVYLLYLYNAIFLIDKNPKTNKNKINQTVYTKLQLP